MWFAAVIASLTFLAHRCFASTNLLQKKKIQVGWEQMDKKAALVPGMPELGMGIPTNKAAFHAELSPYPIDRYHSGNPERDTCPLGKLLKFQCSELDRSHNHAISHDEH